MTVWQAHGTAVQRVVDRVMYIKVIGGFNLEGAEDNSSKIIQKVREQFSDGMPWSNFHDLTHFELGTPEMKGVAERHYQWSLENRMTHEAILAPSVMAREMMQMMVAPFSEAIHFAYFDNMGDALDWLVIQGFLQANNRSVLSHLHNLQHIGSSVVDVHGNDKPTQ